MTASEALPAGGPCRDRLVHSGWHAPVPLAAPSRADRASGGPGRGRPCQWGSGAGTRTLRETSWQTPSGFLSTYDVVGQTRPLMSQVGPTTSYLPDVANDVVGQNLRCRTHTTSWVMAYNVDIRYRRSPTYDVVTYDVQTISSKPTMLYVQLQSHTVFIVGSGLYIICDVHHIVLPTPFP
jgi:hypothetical protein